MKPTPDRPPPFSAEVEAAVLGCALLDHEAARAVASLDADCFYDARHRDIHAALKCLNGETNLVSLHEQLAARGKLDRVGGDTYLAQLLDKTPSAANLPVHLEALNNYALRRAAIRDAAEVERIARDNSLPLGAVADASRRLLQAHAADALRRQGFTRRPASEIVDMAFGAEDNLLGDRLIAKGQSFVIAGAGGIGKSRLLLQLLACLIAGRPFCGMDTHNSRGSRWLVIQAENSNRRIQFDLRNLRHWLGADWPLVADNLIFHTLETDRDLVLNLSIPGTEIHLCDLVRDVNPVGVVFDPLKDLGFGDLNTDADMLATCHALSRITRAGNPERILGILHHGLTGRAGAAKATGFDRSSFARNSKALHAWTRAQINVAPGTEDYSTLVLSCGKCSNGREFPTFAVTMDPAMIYAPDDSFDLSEWQKSVADTGNPKASKSLMPPARVRQLVSVPLSKADLAKAIVAEINCKLSNTYRYIDAAEEAGAITLSKHTALYCAS